MYENLGNGVSMQLPTCTCSSNLILARIGPKPNQYRSEFTGPPFTFWHQFAHVQSAQALRAPSKTALTTAIRRVFINLKQPESIACDRVAPPDQNR